MDRSFKLGRFATVAASLALFACADGSLSTSPANVQTVGTRASASAVTVNAVAWGPGHVQQTFNVWARITVLAGGSLSIPQCDMTLIVPPGAVASDLDIKATCVNDGYVGYRFLPHISFLKPVSLIQGLSNTDVVSGSFGVKRFAGAYLDDASDFLGAGGLATPSEFEKSLTSYGISPVTGLSVPVSQTWILQHFSRYILASGSTEIPPEQPSGF